MYNSNHNSILKCLPFPCQYRIGSGKNCIYLLLVEVGDVDYNTFWLSLAVHAFGSIRILHRIDSRSSSLILYIVPFFCYNSSTMLPTKHMFLRHFCLIFAHGIYRQHLTGKRLLHVACIVLIRKKYLELRIRGSSDPMLFQSN